MNNVNENKFKTLLDWALYYESLNLSVIPVGKDKRPKEAWSKYQKERASQEKIKDWWKRYPDANIGIITGGISNIVVLDFDKKHNRSSREFKLPVTACSKTGNDGEHFFFKHPKFEIKNSTSIDGKEGLDFRGDGGYVVVAPSVNENGGKYEWIISLEDEIADLPEQFIKLLNKDSSTVKKWLKGIDGVSEGGRNDTAISMAGKIMNDIEDERLIDKIGWNYFITWNNTNKPPLSEIELKNVWESAKKMHCDKSLLKRSVLEKPKEGCYKVALHLSKKHNIKTVGRKNRTIYLYKDGYYQEGLNDLRQEIQNILEEAGNTKNKNEIIDIVKDLTYIEIKNIKPNLNLINLNNGVFNLENNKLLEHDESFAFFTKIPIDYNPKSTCPHIEKFLLETLGEQNLNLIQEWLGFLLYRKYFIKKAVILVGERDTGKTTLLNLIIKFIGKENISGVSLQKISTDKFSVAHLLNKHLNTYDDLSPRDINDNGAFKMITGGGHVTGEFKFGDQFQFENYAKLTFSCNKIPSVKDTRDDAYFSRWIIVQFNNVIEKPDKFLIDKITTEEELSGLLNFAIKGLKRLLEEQEFSYKKNPDEIKEEMLKSGSPIVNFIYDCLQQGENSDWISKQDLYSAFCDYAKKEGLPLTSLINFGRQINKHVDYISDKKNGSETGWCNVRLINSESSRDNRDNPDLSLLDF
jgi:putative DNA primase/helicase